MNSNPTRHLFSLHALLHWMLPVVALVCGALVYLFSRESAPEILLQVQQLLRIDRSLVAPISVPFAGQLPSFFHALSLLFATRLLTRHDSSWRVPAYVSMIALLVSMELLQLNQVKDSLSAHSRIWQSPYLESVASYVRGGTFDPLDLFSIGLAVLITLSGSMQRAIKHPQH